MQLHYKKGEAAEITDKHLTGDMEEERQVCQERVSAGVEHTSLEFGSPVLAQGPAQCHRPWQLLQARLLSALYVPGQNLQEPGIDREEINIKNMKMWDRWGTETLPAPTEAFALCLSEPEHFLRPNATIP